MKKVKRFLFIETVIKNHKGTILFHGTSFIPQGHSDYNKTIEENDLGIKFRKANDKTL